MESCNRRPIGSGIHLEIEGEEKIEEETTYYFDGITPKRHAKPQRSEYSSKDVDALPNTLDDFIPEFSLFQSLEKVDPQKQLVNKGSKAEEELEEMNDYTNYNSFDEQHLHHKTDNTSDESCNSGSTSVTNYDESSKRDPAIDDTMFPIPESVNPLLTGFLFCTDVVP
ncbi:hypothetical protein L484_022079 [Morus notabilis]|uniref:Uncharacterized protein n=1 Tax=Morus notabilis TaxID=981085 RepID=W9SDX3_9ROSA|nr:uncharacterized protein LOC21404907 isoform X2 [Morus notabilis]EXC01501.1 hypothetical protein L484_022079 [Morus notabilis]